MYNFGTPWGWYKYIEIYKNDYNIKNVNIYILCIVGWNKANNFVSLLWVTSLVFHSEWEKLSMRLCCKIFGVRMNWANYD